MAEDVSTAGLQALVAELSERLTALEDRVATLEGNQQIPDDVMVAISAAVAAFLGHKATVKAVRLRNSRSWSTEARGRVHNRSVN
ncbi:hypothetical protein ACTQ49_08230 [Luteococcus sp. Sow4_B9]|uniref:hypothetical protein n=1 Tax=Luteococcus sp. Sow4_B9 TaxID=3438792 RepID=UPI003F947A3A